MALKIMNARLEEDLVEWYYKEFEHGGRLEGMSLWKMVNGLLLSYKLLLENEVLEGTKSMYGISSAFYKSKLAELNESNPG